MPWCPKCKNEYKEGYTVCADCGSNLVDSLDNGPVAIYFGTEAELYEICNFMTSNGISKVQVSFDEKEDIYELLVPSADVSEAQKQLRVYLSRIAAPRMQAETENNDVTNATDSKEAEFYNGPYEEAEKKSRGLQIRCRYAFTCRNIGNYCIGIIKSRHYPDFPDRIYQNAYYWCNGLNVCDFSSAWIFFT